MPATSPGADRGSSAARRATTGAAALLTATRRIALGAYLPGYQLDPEAALAHYVDLTGRPPAIVHWFQRWSPDGEFEAAPAMVAQATGALPMLSWEPWQGLGPIVSGELDDYIRRFASDVAAHAEPVLLRFAHEMNLRGIHWHDQPGIYRAAWERVRATFGEAGAGNARFVWSPYVADSNAVAFEPYYPGDAQVDWLALDGYNWGRRRRWSRWPSFETIFAGSLASLTRLAPDKPIMLAEIGCTERGGDKARWIRDALLEAIPGRYPAIRAVVWFNKDRPDHADWRIDSSPATLAAWRQTAADPRYSLTGSELLDL